MLRTTEHQRSSSGMIRLVCEHNGQPCMATVDNEQMAAELEALGYRRLDAEQEEAEGDGGGDSVHCPRYPGA